MSFLQTVPKRLSLFTGEWAQLCTLKQGPRPPFSSQCGGVSKSEMDSWGRSSSPGRNPNYVCLRFYFFLFRERGTEEEREGETSMCERNVDRLPLARPQPETWPTTQACALTGNRTGDLSVCKPVLDPLSHPSQGSPNYFEAVITIISTRHCAGR